ncbi:hypothetical protein C8Q74DRAFT_307653 [Fomes fomentarius]|nr:hypothetical protein C8Q74DRAFT_307653 [Fomes fomentarius]
MRDWIALGSWALLSLAPPVAPLLVNHTIDDEIGDSVDGVRPVYFPLGTWSQGSQCMGCAIHTGIVDPHMAFDGTWHDSTYFPGGPGGPGHTITVKFTGVAVYVYHLLANSGPPGVARYTNLTFYLDDDYVGVFCHVPAIANTTTIQYHVPVYVNTTLPDAPHTLVISSTGSDASLILFDFVVYTVVESDKGEASSSSNPSSATHTPPPPIPLSSSNIIRTTIYSSPISTVPSYIPSPSDLPITIVIMAIGAALLFLSILLYILYRRHDRLTDVKVQDASNGAMVHEKTIAHAEVQTSHGSAEDVHCPSRSSRASDALATVSASIGSSRAQDTSTTRGINSRSASHRLRKDVSALLDEAKRLREERRRIQRSQRLPSSPADIASNPRPPAAAHAEAASPAQ